VGVPAKEEQLTHASTVHAPVVKYAFSVVKFMDELPYK
jgi:hypothetical protein